MKKIFSYRPFGQVMTCGRVRESEQVLARFAMLAGSRTCQREANNETQISVSHGWHMSKSRAQRDLVLEGAIREGESSHAPRRFPAVVDPPPLFNKRPNLSLRSLFLPVLSCRLVLKGRVLLAVPSAEPVRRLSGQPAEAVSRDPVPGAFGGSDRSPFRRGYFLRGGARWRRVVGETFGKRIGRGGRCCGGTSFYVCLFGDVQRHGGERIGARGSRRGRCSGWGGGRRGRRA